MEKTFGVSPFGIYCRVGNKHLNCNYQTIKMHITRSSCCIGTNFSAVAINEFVSNANKEMELLKNSNTDLEDYLTKTEVNGFICANCAYKTRHMQGISRHCHSINSNQQCKLNGYIPVKLRETICGRLIRINKYSYKFNNNMQTTFDTTIEMLKKYVKEEEDNEMYVGFFHRFILRYNTEKDILKVFDQWNEPVKDDDVNLTKLIENTRHWLFHYARWFTMCTPGDLRSRMIVFDSNEVGDITQNSTFNFRQETTSLWAEAEKLLVFAWRSENNPTTSEMKRSVQFLEKNPYFGAYLIAELFIETPPTVWSNSIVCDYVASRCFRVTSEKKLYMISSDSISRQSACVLSLLRSAMCTRIHGVEGPMTYEGTKRVLQARNSWTTNMLCPFIRITREITRQKAPKRPKTITASGDIFIEEFDFKMSIWSKLIPKLELEIDSIFKKCFNGDSWRAVIDENNHVCVGKNLVIDITKDCAKMYENMDLHVNSETVPATTYDRLRSLFDVALSICGGGVTRGMETERMSVHQTMWHQDCVYYFTLVKKIYRLKSHSKPKKRIEHKMPKGLSRRILLYRAIVEQLYEKTQTQVNDQEPRFEDKMQLLPKQTKENINMMMIVSEIFCFRNIPSRLQVRQFGTSLSDFLFPSQNWNGNIVAEEHVTEMSGHSLQSRHIHYSSQLECYSDQIFELYHEKLGDERSSTRTNTEKQEEICDEQLLMVLRKITHKDSTWTCNEQKKICISVIKPNGKHTVAIIPCGFGKSMAWQIYTAAQIEYGWRKKMVIVVVPYNFLSASLQCVTNSNLTNQYDVMIESYTGEDINRENLPEELQSDALLPHLIFVNINAMANLMKFYPFLLVKWKKDNQIQAILIDEAHTFMTEVSFREEYSEFKTIARFSIPIIAMSATFPAFMLQNYCRVMNLSSGIGNDVNIIQSCNFLGNFPNDFRFNVVMVKQEEVLLSVISRVREILQRRQGQKRGIHIICATINDANRINDEIDFATIALVSSQISMEEQQATANDWYDGKYDVLVTTTCGIVGNENSDCKHVIIVRYLYDLFGIVQALGRLRPRQRQNGASFEIYSYKVAPQFMAEMQQKELDKYYILQAHGFTTSHDLFNDCSTATGVVNWLQNNEKCKIQHLCSLMGYRVVKCGFCCICRKEPISMLAEKATEEIVINSRKVHEAKNLLLSIAENCIVCRQKHCTGLSCMGKNRCYACGGCHFTKACTVRDKLNEVLHGKACYRCFDHHERMGYVRHDSRSCPLQEKLKRFIIHSYQKEKENKTLLQFVASIYASINTFNKFCLETVKDK